MEKIYLRLPQVLALIPISKTYFYAGIACGVFPTPIKLGRTSVWSADSLILAMEKIAAKTSTTQEAA